MYLLKKYGPGPVFFIKTPGVLSVIDFFKMIIFSQFEKINK